MSNTFTQKVGGGLSSRRAAILLSIAALAIAAILLIVYVQSYRSSVNGENAPTNVIVAKNLIPAGTSGTIIATKHQYQSTTLPQKDIKVGAISDPAYINGRVAVADIVPGQQLTTTDFTVPTTTAVTTKITGKQRAISVNVDNVHGSLSQLAANDQIDIYIGLGSSGGQSIVKLFRPNVKVLAVPVDGAGNLILQINTKDAADFAYAADNTQFYFVLRPQAGARLTTPSTSSITTLGR